MPEKWYLSVKHSLYQPEASFQPMAGQAKLKLPNMTNQI
jgi:hypothetical protein